MFTSPRYLTQGVQSEIPFELQLILWQLIDELPEPKDYLQVFRLFSSDDKQKVVHEQEEPEYKKDYVFKVDDPVEANIYVIDDGDHSTMLLAEEY